MVSYMGANTFLKKKKFFFFFWGKKKKKKKKKKKIEKKDTPNLKPVFEGFNVELRFF